MPLLRLIQHGTDSGGFQVTLELTEIETGPKTGSCRFPFPIPPSDEESIRWYVEDLPQSIAKESLQTGNEIGTRIRTYGDKLFKSVFQSSPENEKIWSSIQNRLVNTRIEIVTYGLPSRFLPWEWIREPTSQTFLSLSSHSFVRAESHGGVMQPPLEVSQTSPLRILFVIMGPRENPPIPYRSVARKIIQNWGKNQKNRIQLQVLRPPTMEHLNEVLKKSKEEGNPFHIVHLEGYFQFLDGKKKEPGWDFFSSPDSESNVYLVFDNLSSPSSGTLVSGFSLGELLKQTGVSILVLNSSQTHYFNAPIKSGGSNTANGSLQTVGSVAREVSGTGLAGLVSLDYKILPERAEQFLSGLYSSLLQGEGLGEAATKQRRLLNQQPIDNPQLGPNHLLDWFVPLVYETKPCKLFVPSSEFSLIQTGTQEPQREIDPDLPAPPEHGFIGRDETLLSLDQMFTHHQVLLLHATSGFGKTAAGSAFGTWYYETEGVKGPVFFSSFSRPQSLTSLLDHIGQAFWPNLKEAGVNWLALPLQTRQVLVLQLFKQIPVLWIWDSVEQATSGSKGEKPDWSEQDRNDVVHFLKSIADTKAKILLTSHGEESDWLGNLPARIQLPPLSTFESARLAHAALNQNGKTFPEEIDWQPLFQFSKGNPRTLLILANQVIQEQRDTQQQLEELVLELESDLSDSTPLEEDGRTPSLEVSLNRGARPIIADPKEQKILGLLGLFQGFVNVEVLQAMRRPISPDVLTEIEDLTHEEEISILDRAAARGLLVILGEGLYGVHSSSKSAFRQQFDRLFPQSKDRGTVKRLFVDMIADMSFYCASQLEQEKNDGLIHLLGAEERNILYCFQISSSKGWWDATVKILPGIKTLYMERERWAEWYRIVENMALLVTNPKTGWPLADKENEWRMVHRYRLDLAKETGWKEETLRLQKISVEVYRKMAEPNLHIPRKQLEPEQTRSIQKLVAALLDLARFQIEMGNPDGVDSYKESLELSRNLGDREAEAVTAFNLGHAYKNLPTISDLNQAENWYRNSLELYPEEDRLNRGKCFNQLGGVAFERLKQEVAQNKSEQELSQYVNQAIQHYSKAIDLLPPEALEEIATVHNALGIIFSPTDLDRALRHYKETIRCRNDQKNFYWAGKSRVNVALTLFKAKRFPEAIQYAQAALENFKLYGNQLAEDINKTQKMIALIEKEMKSDDPGAK